MAISEPVPVYNAENNVEAHLVSTYLEKHGIEAHAMLDESVGGIGPLGPHYSMLKPQVWIDKSNVEAAQQLLTEYERELVRRRRESPLSLEPELETIAAICEECGKKTLFPESKNGTTQDCQHCGAFVDVGDLPFDLPETNDG